MGKRTNLLRESFRSSSGRIERCLWMFDTGGALVCQGKHTNHRRIMKVIYVIFLPLRQRLTP